MSSELLFRPESDTAASSANELRQGLAAELGSPHAAAIREDGTSLELVDFGISLSLAFDEKGDLIAAAATLPSNVDFGHVAQFCKALLGVGWTLESSRVIDREPNAQLASVGSHRNC